MQNAVRFGANSIHTPIVPLRVAVAFKLLLVRVSALWKMGVGVTEKNCLSALAEQKNAKVSGVTFSF